MSTFSWESATKGCMVVIRRAQEEAARGGAETVRPEHLLLAMLDDPTCVPSKLLLDLGASIDPLRQEIKRLVDALPSSTGVSPDRLSDDAMRVMEIAMSEAPRLRDGPRKIEL